MHSNWIHKHLNIQVISLKYKNRSAVHPKWAQNIHPQQKLLKNIFFYIKISSFCTVCLYVRKTPQINRTWDSSLRQWQMVMAGREKIFFSWKQVHEFFRFLCCSLFFILFFLFASFFPPSFFYNSVRTLLYVLIINLFGWLWHIHSIKVI